jgi:chloramphenicol 3-O phosphotransferase
MITPMASPGPVVILNGAPRSGKSSIAVALDSVDERRWRNLGVDSVMADLTPEQHPGIGLRPGGERPDLEDAVLAGYRTLFAEVATAATDGSAVAVDVGIHQWFSKPLGLWQEVARCLADTPSFVVGVRCSLPVILERRAAAPRRGRSRYVTSEEGSSDAAVPTPVARWQQAVHDPGRYDFEVDTTTVAAELCARNILAYTRANAPTALGIWRADVDRR